jgi:hypothetical protein
VYATDSKTPTPDQTSSAIVPVITLPNVAAITVISVPSISNINVPNGTALGAVGLPTSTPVVLSNGTTTLPVTWNGGTPTYNGNASGTYAFTGTLTLPSGVTNPSSTTASVKVVVAAPAVTAALTAPVITGSTSTQTTATIDWAGSTGGVAPITYTILRNGISVGTTTASATTFTDTGLTPSTTYSYVVRATDSAKPTPSAMDSASSSVTTLASTGGGGGSTSTLPMASIVSPQNGASASGTITVTVNATDTVSAITKVRLIIDGVFGLKASTSSPYLFTVDTLLLSNGKHTLMARAIDAAGNVATSTTIGITVNNNGNYQPGKGSDDNGNGGSDDGIGNGGNGHTGSNASSSSSRDD